jgi:hypothetical protein
VSVEDEFPVPPGDPGAVRAAGNALGRIARDLHGLDGAIRAERAGMQGAWTGEAATAATTETTSLATITGDEGARVADGAEAFGRYGSALGTAITDVEQIRRQALAADSEARSEAGRTGRNLPTEDRQAIYAGLRDQSLAPLRVRYRAALDTLSRQAREAAGALTAAVPEYRSGMSDAQLALRVRNSVAARLPSVLRLDGEARGRALADEINPLLRKGARIPDQLLARLEADKDNPWFAKTLLERLGPTAPWWSMLSLQGNGYPPDHNERVIRDFGQLIALGTRTEGPARLSDQYVDDLLRPLDQHDGAGLLYAWELGHLLHFGGTFGTAFLTKTGDKLYALDRVGYDTEMYSMATWMARPPLTVDRVPADPMEAYFDAIARDARAAQAFFRGHADRLDYYLKQRATDSYLGDRGESLGNALVAATTVYRNGEDTGRASAEIAVTLLRSLGEEGHDFLIERDRERLTPAIGTILTSYADDIYHVLSRQNQKVIDLQDPSLPQGVRRGDEELGTDGYGISLPPEQIRQLLGQVDHDLASYARVLQSQLDAANRFLEADLAHARAHPGDQEDVLVRYGSGYGRMLDTLFSTHMQVQHALGAEKDDQKGTVWLGIVSAANVLGSIIPFAPALQAVPLVLRLGFNVTAGGSLPWLINNAVNTANADAADAASVRKINEWYLLNQYEQIDRLQNGGAFAGSPADADRWMRENDIPPEARFTGPDGKVLPQAQLTDAQAEAYLRWHVDESGHGVGQETSQLVDAIESQVRVDPPKIR